MVKSSQDRPPLAVAMQWVSQITTVSLEMSLPALLGYWLDSKWQTEPWLVVVGGVLGFVVGIRHLLQMVKMSESSQKSQDRTKKP